MGVDYNLNLPVDCWHCKKAIGNILLLRRSSQNVMCPHCFTEMREYPLVVRVPAEPCDVSVEIDGVTYIPEEPTHGS